MDPERTLLTLLLNDADLIALVRERIYADIMPATSVFPLVVYALSSQDAERTLDGPAGVDQSRYTLDIWAQTHAEAREVAAAVRQALDGQRNQQGTTQFFIAMARATARFDDASQLYQVTQDYLVSADTP